MSKNEKDWFATLAGKKLLIWIARLDYKLD